MSEGETNSLGFTDLELRIATLQILYSEDRKSSSGTSAKVIADVLQSGDRLSDFENALLEHRTSGFVEVFEGGYRITRKGLEHLIKQLDSFHK